MTEAFVCNEIPTEVLKPLREVASVTVWDGEMPITEEDLCRSIATCAGLLTTVNVSIDDAVLDAAPELRVISQMAVGVDNIDVKACANRQIQIGHTPDVLTETVADTAFALLAAIVRRIPEGERVVRSGRWGPWDPWFQLGGDIHGSTLGIVGMGRIGRAVAKRASGFDMRVLYSSPREVAVSGAYRAPLDVVLAEADIVVLAAPLTPETQHMIGAREFDLMKPTAFLVNVGRGPLVSTDALVSVLQSDRLAGVALDVTDPEPLPVNHPLLGFDNCLVVPHIGSASVRTRLRMAELAVENLVAGLLGLPMPAQLPTGSSFEGRD